MRIPSWYADHLTPLCESPIESKLLAALLDAAEHVEPPTDIDLTLESISIRYGGCQIDIAVQQQIDRYRVDLLLDAWRSGVGRALFSPPESIVVEADGHDFHEKTREQAARDKRRDRELAALHHSVLRFTGSEIFRDAPGAAHEILELCLLKTGYRDTR